MMSAASRENIAKTDWTKFPDCCLCADKGLGLGWGQYDYVFCACPAGVRLEFQNSEAANEANAIRAKLGMVAK